MLILMSLLRNEGIFMNEGMNGMSYDWIMYVRLNDGIVLRRRDALRFLGGIRIREEAFLRSIMNVGCLDALRCASSIFIIICSCSF